MEDKLQNITNYKDKQIIPYSNNNNFFFSYSNLLNNNINEIILTFLESLKLIKNRSFIYEELNSLIFFQNIRKKDLFISLQEIANIIKNNCDKKNNLHKELNKFKENNSVKIVYIEDIEHIRKKILSKDIYFKNKYIFNI